MSLPAPIPFALDPRLRSLGLASPFAMAPMSGVTNAPFRLLARRAGAAQTFSETLSARRLVRRGEAPRLSLVGDDEVAAQIFGGDAEEMAEAAGRLGERGVRWVDLNFGCPVKKFIRAGAGAALLRDPTRALRLVEAVRRRVTGVLSVKLRAGWDEGQRNAPELARALGDLGVDLISIHGRTRRQAYRGRSDPEIIREVVEAAAPLPVMANGDVCSLDEGRQLIVETGAAGVLIGRAAARDPWLFREEPCDLAFRRNAWRQSLSLLLAEGQADSQRLHPLRKLVACVLRGLPLLRGTRRQLSELQSVGALVAATEEIFEASIEGHTELAAPGGGISP